MCGIAGVLVESPDLLVREDLARLGAALAHRGPDGTGTWVRDDGRAAFVHLRLAILDLSERGAQPMTTADGRYTVVYNGEIYNFLELRAELEKLGSRFRTDADTEVILEAWRHWGEGMLPRFNGMWAFALSDNVTGRIFFARDRFGIKPLLYCAAGGRLAFASEMRGLLALPWVPRRIDEAVAARVLYDAFSVEGSEHTLFAAVRRLPAGHCADVVGTQVRVRRWWNTLEHLPEPIAAADRQAEAFRETFTDAVRLRLRSDVPVGTCLSGGFDSSAILCTMSRVARSEHAHLREARDWQRAYVASFPGKSNDETPQALEAAAYAGVAPHVFTVRDADALDHVDTVLDDLDDVYVGVPTAPWLIYRELRRAHTVVSLDGHGADELMGGYRQGGEALGFALRNAFSRLLTGPRAFAAMGEAAKFTWLRSRRLAFLRGHRATPPEPLALVAADDRMPAHWGLLNRRLYRMFHSTVLPTILRNFDRLSMAHGIEVRMPFMDWRLVCLTMSLPDDAKATAEWSKAVARRALAGGMPDSIRTATRKVGFNSPMPEWLNGPLAPWMERALAQPTPAFASLVDVDALRARVRELTARGEWTWDAAGRLWPYAHLNWYLQRHGAT
jgi:asparagine synthase (glutamine-hydrolysing)